MSRARLPRCADCGGMECRVVGYVLHTPQGDRVSHVWLCASCEYRRINPDAPRAVRMPRERPAASLQSETLF
jgi:C4-type Zn-finger protein